MKNVVPKNASEKIPSITISLSIDKKDKKGKSIVHLVVYIDRKKLKFNTGVKLVEGDWDSELKRVRKSNEHAKDYNLIINNSHSRLHDALVRFKLQFREITAQALKDEYASVSLL